MNARNVRVAALVFTAALLMPAVAARAASDAPRDAYEETVDQTFPLNPDGAFSLTNINGAVTLTAWDKPEVHVVAVKKMKQESDGWWLSRIIGLKGSSLKTDADAQALFKEFRVEFGGDQAARTVVTRQPRTQGVNFSVRYEVSAPKGAKISIDTVNSSVEVSGIQAGAKLETTNGAVRVSDARGTLHTQSTNGRVTLEGVAGAIIATTTNGSVSASLRPDAKLEAIDMSSVNGSVRLSVPASAGFDLTARTVNGSVSCEIPLASISAQTRKRLEAKIGASGPRVELSTVNGSVRISSAG